MGSVNLFWRAGSAKYRLGVGPGCIPSVLGGEPMCWRKSAAASSIKAQASGHGRRLEEVVLEAVRGGVDVRSTLDRSRAYRQVEDPAQKWSAGVFGVKSGSEDGGMGWGRVWPVLVVLDGIQVSVGCKHVPRWSRPCRPCQLRKTEILIWLICGDSRHQTAKGNRINQRDMRSVYFMIIELDNVNVGTLLIGIAGTLLAASRTGRWGSWAGMECGDVSGSTKERVVCSSLYSGQGWSLMLK